MTYPLLMLAALWAFLSGLAPHEATVLAARLHGLQRYWDEARGYAVVLTRAGRRGLAPWR